MRGNVQQVLVNHLTHVYNDRYLFKDLSFAVKAGEFMHVVGVNGAGKTTLLRILAGLLLPNDGNVSYSTNPKLEHKAIGYLGHKDGLKRDVSVWDNFLLNTALFGVDHTLTEEKAEEVLTDVNLLDYKDYLVKELSTGQRKRLALACLFVREAKLWILDEPCAALDKEGSLWLKEKMALHVKAGGILIVATHQGLDIVRYMKEQYDIKVTTLDLTEMNIV